MPLHSVKAVGTWRSAPAAEMLDINLRGQTKRLCVPTLLTDCYIPLSSALAKTKGLEMGRSLPSSPLTHALWLVSVAAVLLF